MSLQKGICIFLILGTLLVGLQAQGKVSPLSIEVLPGGSFLLTGNKTIPVKIGPGGKLAFTLESAGSGFYLAGEIGAEYIPINQDLSATIFSANLGAGYKLVLLPRFNLLAGVQGGYFYSLLSNDNRGGNPSLKANLGAEFKLTDTMGLGLDLGYHHMFYFYSSLQASLGLKYHFPLRAKAGKQLLDSKPKLLQSEIPAVKRGNGLGLSGLILYDVFPVFYKYYDNNPIGKAILHNWEKKEAEDIQVTFFIKNLMDYPTNVKAPQSLKPGEEAVIDIHSLLSSKVLDLSESTKVSVNLKISYEVKGEPKTEEIIETLRIYDRNAITWDDNNKAAAFVTHKENGVLKLSKNIVGLVQDQDIKIINRNLLNAIGIFGALSTYGITYVIDPTTPYEDFSRNALAVDYLQFPIQTLEYKAGDCDDLSILFSALLESIGIPTAFITIPGHIFSAFSLNLTQEEAVKTFHNLEDFIFLDGNTWIPIEVTMLDEGFMQAWHEGAKQWREYQYQTDSGFYPVHDAWQLYEPVGFVFNSEILVIPDKQQIADAFYAQVEDFISREIYPKRQKILAEITQQGETAKSRNELGVLYARYGKVNEAKAEFEKIVNREVYVPALINLGNVFYLEDDMTTALTYYSRALKLEPENTKLLVAVARANYIMEQYEDSRVAYNKLKELDSGLAENYSYLELKSDDKYRAGNASQKGDVLWEE